MSEQIDNGSEVLDENYSAGEELRQKGRESPLKAILHIGLVALICGGGIFFYWGYVEDTKKINDLVNNARKEFQKADDFVSLQKARELLLQSLEIRSNNRALAGLANINASLWGLHGIEERRAEAEEYTAKAVEADIPNGDRFAAEGYLKIFSGKPEEADTYLTSILERGAQDPKVLHALGLAKLVQGQTRTARDAFRKAIDLSAGAPRFSVAMADAYFRDGEYTNAWTFYNRAKVANQEHTKARIGRVLATCKQGGDYEQLTKEIQRVLDEPPERLSPKDKNFAEYTAAEIALAKGDSESAARFVSDVLKRDDKDARLYYLRARLEQGDNKIDDAIKSYDRAVELDPYTAAYYFDAATMLRDAKRPAEAVDRIKLYGLKNYQSDEYKNHLGLALAEKGDFTAAEELFNKMLEANANDADAMLGLGYVYELQQKWEEARIQYGTADQRRQGWGEPWFRMGHVAVGEKNFEEARAFFEEALKRYEKTKAPRASQGKAVLGIALAWDKEGKARQATKERERAKAYF